MILVLPPAPSPLCLLPPSLLRLLRLLQLRSPPDFLVAPSKQLTSLRARSAPLFSASVPRCCVFQAAAARCMDTLIAEASPIAWRPPAMAMSVCSEPKRESKLGSGAAEGKQASAAGPIEAESSAATQIRVLPAVAAVASWIWRMKDAHWQFRPGEDHVKQ